LSIDFLDFFGRSERQPVRDIQKLFGDRMKEIRLEKGFSQEGLAAAADLHRTYVSSVERGERNVSIINIARLADALNVPIREFFPSR
jgi:transcriptional regulator with XRE-family HTH domain